MKKTRKTQLHFSLIIPLVCLLLTFVLWDYYFNSPRPFDRTIASHLILVMGLLFSVVTGLFIRSLESNLTEVEKRKRFEGHLLRARQAEAIGRLAAGIAHDFNNLLIAVAGYSEFLIEGLGPEGAKHGEAERIRALAARGSNLARQLLALSGRQIVEPKIINLNEVVLNTDQLLREFLGEDIELVTVPGEKLGMIKVDPSQLEQVLMNLAVNARDAMPKGGKLVIETSNIEMDKRDIQEESDLAAGKYVLLAVSDTGCGMSEDTREHIFEPYFSTKEKDQGTGLGLATVYGVVKHSGGHMTVWSELNRGTAFKIYFPRTEGKLDSLPKTEEVRPITLGSETVLLVEDEMVVRNVMREVLRRRHYEVIETSNGSEALRFVEEQLEKEIHLLLADMVMPQMGGKELADRVRSIRPGLKVLFTSGYTDDSISYYEELGPGTAFIQKPFSPDALALKVREVLDGK